MVTPSLSYLIPNDPWIQFVYRQMCHVKELCDKKEVRTAFHEWMISVYAMGDRIRTWWPVKREMRVSLEQDFPYVARGASKEEEGDMVSRYDVLYALIREGVLKNIAKEEKKWKERGERQRMERWIRREFGSEQ